MLLEGKTALITGAAQGIGFAIAKRFLDEGGRVVLMDQGADALAHAADLLAATDRLLTVPGDVTKLGDFETAVSSTVDWSGRLDVLVNNAGITRDAVLSKMTEEQFDSVVDVCLKGCWVGLKAVAPQMRAQGSGSVINMSSISGKSGIVGQTNYSAAKAGVVGLTKSAAQELARYSIRVNAIQPGLIKTAMTDAIPAEVMVQKLALIPLGRPGDPDEVAGVATFLASNLASYVTGAVIEVTGGRLM